MVQYLKFGASYHHKYNFFEKKIINMPKCIGRTVPSTQVDKTNLHIHTFLGEFGGTTNNSGNCIEEVFVKGGV